jgi:acetyl esterase/lipase
LAFLLTFAKAEGCAVVSVDYRLAPETKLPDIISDIEEAFRWLAGGGAKQFHLDPRRIVVAGASAGGYLTLVAGYRVRPKPKALVALYGFGDLIGDWSTKPNPYPELRKISRQEAESQTDGMVVRFTRITAKMVCGPKKSAASLVRVSPTRSRPLNQSET